MYSNWYGIKLMPSGGPYGSLQSVHQGQAEAFEKD